MLSPEEKRELLQDQAYVMLSEMYQDDLSSDSWDDVNYNMEELLNSIDYFFDSLNDSTVSELYKLRFNN